jgi:hypothetical protein
VIVENPETDQPTPAIPLPVLLAYSNDICGSMPARPGGTANGTVKVNSPFGVTAHDEGKYPSELAASIGCAGSVNGLGGTGAPGMPADVTLAT